jgi:hypothetical protein
MLPIAPGRYADYAGIDTLRRWQPKLNNLNRRLKKKN